MKVTANLNNLRISPRKVRLVANFIRGIEVNAARIQLVNIVKKSTDPMLKLIDSAICNAENNFGLDRNNLYVYDIQVGEGVKLKRWAQKAYGRAAQILKRSSRVSLILEEVVEGKNRKTKEQLEKERKQREDEKKKVAAEAAGEGEEKNQTVVKKEIKNKTEDRKSAKKGGWAKKMFQRKSA